MILCILKEFPSHIHANIELQITMTKIITNEVKSRNKKESHMTGKLLHVFGGVNSASATKSVFWTHV